MTLLEKLNEFPPCLCRIVARHPRHTQCGRRLTLHEISKASGISYGVAVRLSRQRKWDGATIDIAHRFSSACGVNLLRPGRKMQYLKRTLRSPNGLKRLSGTGRQSPKAVLKMLKSLL